MRFRVVVAGLMLSASGLVGIALNEGYRGAAYIPIPGDVPTIGFGATGDVKLGDTTTPERALARALVDVGRFESGVKSCVTVPLYQYEYDAYVSLAYNIGQGAFCGSTLVRKLNAGDYSGACAEILRWHMSGGRSVPGLVNRRQGEYRQCMGRDQ